jgi:hypothetical protein
MAERARFFDGRKFMWDGTEYDDQNKAAEVEKEYEGKGFEVQRCTEDGKMLLYSRRVAAETAVSQG